MERKIKAPGFVAFISSPSGRALRIVVGLAMIVGGFLDLSVLGAFVCALGFIPFLAGAFDVCVLGPLFGGFFRGDKMRVALHLQAGHPELGTHAQNWLKA